MTEPEEDFAALFEASVKAARVERGDTIEGTIVAIGPGLRDRLDLPLRLGLKLLVGLGLVFLLEYLDENVHERADLEALGIRVVGEIPAPRGRWRKREGSALPGRNHGAT